MIYFYRFFYFILSYCVDACRVFFSTSLQNWILLRNTSTLKIQSRDAKPELRLLFHASSGEIEYVKSLIREIKTQKPLTQIFVSYSSPSAEKLFSNIQPYVEAFLPLPWDRPKSIQNFLHILQPQAIIFSRTDFWPELITQASKKNIPLIGVSLSIAHDAISFWQKIWLKFVLNNFIFLTAVNEKTKFQLQQLFLNKDVYFFPDTRFDQVFYRLSQPSKIPDNIIKSIVASQSNTTATQHTAAQYATTDHTAKKKIIFGSTWPEDEAVLLDCVAELLKRNFQIIWSPHDVSSDRTLALQEKLKSYRTVLFSNFSDLNILPPTQSMNPAPLDFDILMLDRIGYLADMYRLTDYAFVGGSFKAKVHSVMEPLCAGNRVVLGPYYENNPEAVRYKNDPQLACVKIVHNSFDFLKTIEIFDSSSVKKEHIIAEMQKNQGASKSICELIFKKIIC